MNVASDASVRPVLLSAIVVSASMRFVPISPLGWCLRHLLRGYESLTADHHRISQAAMRCQVPVAETGPTIGGMNASASSRLQMYATWSRLRVTRS